ncbi:MAG: thermonuclease family protein [Deltaproteobacteria bacterium]|nr:thermonuclease family protein [Deltaproteobacteria bacterium]
MIKTPPYRFLRHLLLLVALSSALPCPAAAADSQWKPVTEELLRKLHLDHRFHKCIAVADGDTIILEELGAVRFIGVDTPEKNHPKLPAQFMSEEASAFTKKLCLGKNIRLAYDAFDEDKRGKYGRILAYLYLEDGTLVQKQLLLNGYAICYTKYPFDQKRKQQFLAWEQKAQQEERGLWKDGGMAEIQWILKHRQLPIQVEKASLSTYRLRMGTWVSKTFNRGDISLNLMQLYEWAYELGPRDLRKQLNRSGYGKKAPPENSLNRVIVLGMAHKKWGILYGKNVKPRVSNAEIDTQINKLYNWIRGFDAEHLQATLALNGYHPLPEKQVPADDGLETANTFFKTEPYEKKEGRVIGWESAKNFVGKRVTVQGKIVRSFNSGKVCFLNFHRNFTRYMSIVIFGSNFRKFPFQPEKFYLNKTIRVRGKIKDHKGQAEIVVESPRQIEIISPTRRGK